VTNPKTQGCPLRKTTEVITHSVPVDSPTTANLHVLNKIPSRISSQFNMRQRIYSQIPNPATAIPLVHKHAACIKNPSSNTPSLKNKERKLVIILHFPVNTLSLSHSEKTSRKARSYLPPSTFVTQEFTDLRQKGREITYACNTELRDGNCRTGSLKTPGSADADFIKPFLRCLNITS